MLLADRRLVLTLCASLLIPVGWTFGDVNLQFKSPTSVSVAQGKTFSTSLQISMGTEQVTAVDYFLLGSASGVFSIKSRNTATSGSVFPDPYSTDTAVATSPSNALSPQNGTDLGASETDVSQSVSGGVFEVADYVITVAAAAPVGTYTLQTTYTSGAGWVGPQSQGFPESGFAHQALMTVTVTPEPTGLVVLAVVGTFALRRRSRR